MSAGLRIASLAIMVTGMMIVEVMQRPRLLPQRSFPRYAYLPGRMPHPLRDPAGHSYRVEPVPILPTLDSDEFAWGADLFNHGYYWEAHEAWEGIWQVAERGSALRTLLKGLILLSAAGVKIREGKRAPAMRHAGRAAGLFRQLSKVPHEAFSQALGISPAMLAARAEASAGVPPVLRTAGPGQPEPVYDFILGNPRSFAP